MIETSPKQIQGEWSSGYALDFHTISSEYLGNDEYGNPQYETNRSDMGEMLYRLKYKSDRSVLRIIVDTAAKFLSNQDWHLDLIIPAPPSRMRKFQPVINVAKGIAKSLGIKQCTDCVVKIKETPQLKDIYGFHERVELLKNAYAVVEREVEGRNILLFDDLYRSGATLNSITQALKNKGRAQEVYTLTLTMTRSIK
ncbi:MAG: ComF family protein [Deltaproteobacteria bacterium]|nr:ComF family protein [Deltaproteobacteria bacterium]